MNSPQLSPEDLPKPLIQLGDIVRLHEPYSAGMDSFSKPQRAALRAFIFHEVDDEIHGASEPDMVPLRKLGADDELAHLVYPTHGIVTEIIGRYRPQAQTRADAYAPHLADEYSDQPRNVSLNLFNAYSGVVYGGGHPIRPRYVDYHVGNLTLITRPATAAEGTYHIDLRDAYEMIGISEPNDIFGEES